MDALSRFWCELSELFRAAAEADDSDQDMIDAVDSARRDGRQTSATDADQARYEWVVDESQHWHNPPGGRLVELLLSERFDIELDRLPRLDECARLALSESSDQLRNGSVIEALAAAKAWLRNLYELDCRWRCGDCESCRQWVSHDDWPEVESRRREALNRLGLYVPLKVRDGLVDKTRATDVTISRRKSGRRTDKKTVRAQQLIMTVVPSS